MMLTITEKCNLNCSYCYEENKSTKVMDKDLAIKLIEKELNSDDDYEMVEIDFHGGEPFICFELIKDICETIWKKKYDKKYYFFATTNGTLFNNEIKSWLKEHKKSFCCCLSIDGNKKMHDINRDNSFDSIDYKFFIETWPIQEVKMTVSEQTLPYLAEGIIFLHKIGFIISENFAYGIDWSNKNNVSILSREYSKLIDYYLENPQIKRCRLLSTQIENLAYDFEEHITCGIGKGMAVYDVEGKRYPCHFFQPNSVGEEKSIQSEKINFSDKTIYSDPICDKCDIKNACPTCYGANYASTGDVAIRDKNMCGLMRISAKATAFLYASLIEKYGVESLKVTKEKEKALLVGIKKVNCIEV